jgi:hypothetical protein
LVEPASRSELSRRCPVERGCEIDVCRVSDEGGVLEIYLTNSTQGVVHVEDRQEFLLPLCAVTAPRNGSAEVP